MSALAKLSLRNRALVALVTVVIAVFGLFALRSLQQELAPSISFPQAAVVTSYPGAAPDVVANDVSDPIEAAIQSVPGLERTSSTSNTNSSLVTAQFTYGTDMAAAEQKMAQAINRIKSSLPDGLDPQVVTGSLDDLPIVQFAITTTDPSPGLADAVRTSVLPELNKVDGVRSADLVGAVGQRVTITPDPEALARAGLTSAAIRTALQQNGVLLPGGEITQDGRTLTVSTGTRLTSTQDITGLPLLPAAGATPAGTGPGGGPSSPAGQGGSGELSTIGDVATVELTDDPVTSISYVDGQPALTVAVTKLPDANTVAVSTAVKDAFGDLQATLQSAVGQPVTFTTVFDQAPFIQQSIDSLATEGLLGLVFAILVILLFLMSVRATLVTAISIPTSVLITFIGLLASDYTLNILTLGALTIAIGRVVDDSIVVIENITRHLDSGQDKNEAVLGGVREVAGAITASTITTVAVFLPIAFVGGIAGELFRPFALTVTIALLASLLVALTIVPVLAYWFLRPQGASGQRRRGRHEQPPPAAVAADEDGPPTRLQRGYRPIIEWTLRHSVATLVLAVLVLVGTFALAPLMKTNFLGQSGQNTFTVTQQVADGASLDQQRDTGLASGTAIAAVPGVQTVQMTAGRSNNPLQAAFGGGGGATTIRYSVTTDADADQTAVQQQVRDALGALSDPQDISIGGGGGFGGNTAIAVDIKAGSEADLTAANTAVVDALTGLPEAAQVSSNLSASRPYVAVTVDRQKAAAAGLSEVAVGTLVGAALQPTAIGSVAIDDRSLTVYQAVADPPTTVDQLSGLLVPTARGQVPLSDLATVQQAQGPVSVTAERGQRTATITVTPAGDNLGAANTAVRTALAGVALPTGVTADLGGVTADQAEAFGQLGLALLVAILVVYVVMVATFRSLLQPLLLLVSIPFAATGAILLQIVTGVPLGVPSLIGVLMLIGIVVTNAIVLVDLINQYRERGMTVRDAVEHGASRRLRPILMTALATIFALLPMALGLTGRSGFISQPLAIVVIGGLLSSTVLTLVVLPTLYHLVEAFRQRRRDRRAGTAAPDPMAGGENPAAAEPVPAG
ncbi:efflux RND transporter permease subunit [Nakamurella sp.]|uniref:efflux RND transporter permease subunit n=1 Tax=Nakamurella sp. TaxID=1869182 RepID=UPI003B3B6E97